MVEGLALVGPGLGAWPVRSSGALCMAKKVDSAVGNEGSCLIVIEDTRLGRELCDEVKGNGRACRTRLGVATRAGMIGWSVASFPRRRS